MEIDLSEVAGNARLKDEVLKGLLAYTQAPKELADMSRVYGYTGGAAVGPWIQLDHETGAIKGSVWTFIGDGEEVVFAHKANARAIWPTAQRKCDVEFEIKVSVKFSNVEETYNHIFSRLTIALSLWLTTPGTTTGIIPHGMRPACAPGSECWMRKSS